MNGVDGGLNELGGGYIYYMERNGMEGRRGEGRGEEVLMDIFSVVHRRKAKWKQVEPNKSNQANQIRSN